jgi:glycosyltransferase 2 family protein
VTISIKKNPAGQKVLLFVLKILVAALVLLVLVKRIQIEQLTKALADADVRLIIAACALLGLNVYFQFSKWKLIIHRENSEIGNKRILYSLLIGMALGLATPGRLGDFGRTLLVKNADWARLLGLLMIDKLITLAVLYFVGIIGLSHFISMNMHPYVWLPIFIMAMLLVSAVMLLLLRPMLLRSLAARYHRVSHRFKVIEKLVSGIELATPQLTLKLFVLNVLLTLTYCTQFVLLIFSFYRIAIVQAYFSVFAVMFTKSLLPISLGDLGIRESASVYFFGQAGVPEAAAFNASLILFIINILAPSLLGLGLFLLKRQNKKKTYGKPVVS